MPRKKSKKKVNKQMEHPLRVDTEPPAPTAVPPAPAPIPEPISEIRLESRIPRRNIFLADSFRNERDALVLNKEIGKREHKGRIVKITTIKHMVVTESGDWLTEFVIELKG